MPRHAPRNLDFMGPTAICDTCGKPGWDCHAAGLVCCHCADGLFMHRKFWLYTPCPDCGPGDRALCPSCRSAGVIATPRHEVTIEDLAAEYRAIADRYRRHRYPVPEGVAERLRCMESAPSPAARQSMPAGQPRQRSASTGPGTGSVSRAA